MLKEGWGEVAGDSMTDGSWTKIATTALKGSYEAFKRSWNTCIVLPWKLVIAFKDGKSLEQVMIDWERRDKDLKRAQLDVIKNSGVSETVDAFVGICNPGALMFQKFCEFEDANMKQRWKEGSTSLWNNTIAAKNPDLKIDANEDTQKYSAQIVYANFVISVCNAIRIIIKQKKLNSYDDIQKSNTSLSKHIAESNAVSKDNLDYRSFIKYLTRSLKSNSTVTHSSSGETYTSFIESNDSLKNQLAVIESTLFKKIEKNGISNSKAADIILGNSIGRSLEEISRFIENAKDIHQDFKNFLSSGGKVEVKEKEETEETGEEETGEEETGEEKTGEEKVNSSVKESFVFKKLLIKNNNISLLKESSKSKKAEKAFLDLMNNYYFSHIRLILAVKFVLIKKFAVMKYANTYKIYSDVMKNIEKENYTASNVKENNYGSEINIINKKLKMLNEYLEKESKHNQSLGKDDKLTKELILEIEKGLDGKSVIDYINKMYAVEDNEVINNMINDFAKLMVEDDEKLKESEENKEEEVSNKTKEISEQIGADGKKQINNILVSASTLSVWKDFSEDGTIDRQIQEVNDIENKISVLISDLKKSLSEKMIKRFKQTNNNALNACLEIFDNKKFVNFDEYINIMSELKNKNHEDQIKNLEQLAEEIILKSSEQIKDKDPESDTEDDKSDIVNVSNDYASAVIIDDTNES